MVLLGSLILGVALAASCGLRAFLPLFVLGVAARLGLVDLGDAFVWLESSPALLALAVGVLCEVLADKIPFIHHALDVLATPVRTVAGMLVFAAPVVHLPLWVVAILALIIGGGVALSVHVAKGGLRAASTVATAGAAAPAHSLVEDLVCAGAAIVSVLFWFGALVVAIGAVTLLWLVLRQIRKR